MKALELVAPSTFEFGDRPDPVPGPDEVLIAVKATGICGSDIHGMDGSSGRRQMPIIMGHETSGEIVAVGADVDGDQWKVGDRVTPDSTVYCGKCEYCERGEINLCDDRQVLGVSPGTYRRHGAFADYLAVPARILYRIPEGLSYEHAAMTEPLAVALHAVGRVTIKPTDTAVVVGAGMIGLLCIQALRVAGCREIIAVDLADDKLALAQTLGATAGLNPQTCDVVAEVRARTGGQGADVSLEVVGIQPTLHTAIGVLRRGGSCVLVGNLQPRAEVPYQDLVTKELTLYGTCSCAGEYDRALELLASGEVQVSPFISAVVPLAEGEAWFHRLHAGENGLFKVILQP